MRYPGLFSSTAALRQPSRACLCLQKRAREQPDLNHVQRLELTSCRHTVGLGALEVLGEALGMVALFASSRMGSAYGRLQERKILNHAWESDNAIAL